MPLHEIIDNTVLAAFIIGAIWIYGGLLSARFRACGVPNYGKVVSRFRAGASALVMLVFVVGTLYRVHAIGSAVTAILFTPLVISFLAGLRWLQPYLRLREEDSNHE